VAPLREPEGGLSTGDFERQVTIWRSSPLGSRRDVYKKGLETGVVLHWCPFGETWRRESFTGDFEGKDRYYFYHETLFTKDSEIYVRESSGNGHLSP
jgi:hypothetical protein